MSILDFLPGGRARAERREMDRRLECLRGEIEAARQAGGRAALDRLRTRPAELGLSDDEADLELELLEGLIEVGTLNEQAAGGAPLPVMETNHRALAGEPCHFAAPASRPDIAGDGGGKLFVTPRRLVYIGSTPVTLSWAHVSAVNAMARDIVVGARAERHLVFRCNSYVDALRGAWIASRLLK
ncbi:MAG: hypothetical protein EHM24_11840 [Acidobacteria bacterium]|nr:MAG: hypothetical protein EHM24_11840 [Acidobacteriota bacterium]